MPVTQQQLNAKRTQIDTKIKELNAERKKFDDTVQKALASLKQLDGSGPTIGGHRGGANQSRQRALQQFDEGLKRANQNLQDVSKKLGEIHKAVHDYARTRQKHDQEAEQGSNQNQPQWSRVNNSGPGLV